MRAAHNATHKTETVQRHEDAARPELPEPVREALAYDEPAQADETVDALSVTELREETFYAAAAPADPAVRNEGADGDRTLDELFE